MSKNETKIEETTVFHMFTLQGRPTSYMKDTDTTSNPLRFYSTFSDV